MIDKPMISGQLGNTQFLGVFHQGPLNSGHNFSMSMSQWPPPYLAHAKFAEWIYSLDPFMLNRRTNTDVSWTDKPMFSHLMRIPCSFIYSLWTLFRASQGICFSLSWQSPIYKFFVLLWGNN